jgi:hypothetical protein
MGGCPTRRLLRLRPVRRPLPLKRRPQHLLRPQQTVQHPHNPQPPRRHRRLQRRSHARRRPTHRQQRRVPHRRLWIRNCKPRTLHRLNRKRARSNHHLQRTHQDCHSRPHNPLLQRIRSRVLQVQRPRRSRPPALHSLHRKRAHSNHEPQRAHQGRYSRPHNPLLQQIRSRVLRVQRLRRSRLPADRPRNLKFPRLHH